MAADLLRAGRTAAHRPGRGVLSRVAAALALAIAVAVPLLAQRVGSALSPEAALAQLKRIHHHLISINDAAPISGISTIDQEQASVLAALRVGKPARDAQMTLL
jgi:hypothetical protein